MPSTNTSPPPRKASPASGRRLAKLHGSDVGSASSPLPPRFEADKLTVYATALAEGYPHLGTQVQDITAAVVGALTGTGDGPIVRTHGDYQPKDIYVTRRQTTVIDFDRHARPLPPGTWPTSSASA